jgi:hypothetical protein
MSELVFKVGITTAAIGWLLAVLGGIALGDPYLGLTMMLLGFACCFVFMIADMWSTK